VLNLVQLLHEAGLGSCAAIQIRAVPAFELTTLRAVHHSKGPKGLGFAVEVCGS
jgi:hypothetical protein